MLISIIELGDIKIMREICEKEVNRMISFRGIVVRMSDIIPEMKRACFRCAQCGDELRIALENAKVNEPRECIKCRLKNGY